jgi:hypothetical protein
MPPTPPAQPSPPHRSGGGVPADAAAALNAGIAAGAIVLAPLALGCSGVWSRLALETTMTVLAVISSLFLGRSPWMRACALACCGLAFLQTVPLPDGLLTMLAPVSAGVWKVANVGTSAWGTISIDPAATAVGSRRMLLWLATTIAIGETARQASCRRVLMCALALSAVVIVTLGLAFPVDKSERRLLGFVDIRGPTAHWWISGAHLPVQSDGGGYLEWAPVGPERYRYDQVLVGDGFGPYVGSNQFAGGLCLTLPFLFAVSLMAARRAGSPATGWAVIAALMATATWTLWERAGSRAGTASLLMTEFAFLAAIMESIWARRISGMVAAGYAIGLLVLVAGLVGLLPGLEQVFPEPIRAKVAAFLQDPRAEAATIARRMFLASKLLGTGLNSYGAIFPRFRPGEFTLYYAYNEYTQVLAEAGIVGVATAGMLATPIVRRLALLHTVPTGERPIAAAAVAGIAGLATNMAFEWILHQPANGFLASVTVGLLIAAVPVGSDGEKVDRPVHSGFRRASSGAFVIACGLAWAGLVRDARSDAAVRDLRRALTAARPAPKDSVRPAPRPLLEAALERAVDATAWDPRNALLALLSGQAHLHLAQFEDGPGREAASSVAAQSFRDAQRRRAVILGLPEPMPPPNPVPLPQQTPRPK